MLGKDRSSIDWSSANLPRLKSQKKGTRIKLLNPIKNMCSRIIAAYLALCPGDRNIIDKLIKADTVIACIRDNPSINDIES